MTIIEPMNSQRLKTAPWFFPRKLLIHYFPHTVPLKLTDVGNLVDTVYSSAGMLILVWTLDRKSTRLNSSHVRTSRMPSSA